MEHLNTKQSIVITSIFPPSHAVRAFAAAPGSDVIVVGDLKTPADWACPGARYLGVGAQKALPFTLARALPYNHYCRKMLGYLDAIARGCETIVDTDDDNIPKDDWCFPAFDGDYDTIESDAGFINIYELYTGKKIWPRGLPLRLIHRDFNLQRCLRRKPAQIGIWQGLADEDPDVDAIYRLTDGSPTYFDSRAPVALAQQVIAPFNSQNTQFRKECFPLLYLPTSVTFRFTDILRGLVAQPILWAAGFQVGFTNATVVQKRNPRSPMIDFESEIPMYLQVEAVVEAVSGTVSRERSMCDNLFAAYEALLREGVVADGELTTLQAWLDDLRRTA